MKVTLPLILGGGILFWVYRDFDFSTLQSSLSKVGWGWILFALVFETASHVLRGLRWQQTLRPLGASPKAGHCINAIFLSYAANLIIPRLGEVVRCGVLKKSDNIPLAQSFGTVVTERVVDMMLVVLLILFTLLSQIDIFEQFFTQTGTKFDSFSTRLFSPEALIIAICLIAAAGLAYYLVRTFAFFEKARNMAAGIWKGILSLKNIENIPLFITYTLAIWVGYFLQFYLCFFAFENIAHLSVIAALVIFVAGSVGVMVPTPNGAGSWHFAVISMMVLYGIGKAEAGLFALLVYGSQTATLIILGVWALIALPRKANTTLEN